MQAPPPEEITRLLKERDFNRLAPLIQEKLERIARQRLRALRPGATLDTHALIGELYCKLIGDKIDVEFADRGHFFALASTAMRNVLANYVRKRHAQKRGGDVPKVRIDETGPIPDEERTARLIALDDALDRLAAENKRAAQVIELRYFGGFSVKETAEVLGISPRTVKRDYRAARLWLARAMTQ